MSRYFEVLFYQDGKKMKKLIQAKNKYEAIKSITSKNKTTIIRVKQKPALLKPINKNIKDFLQKTLFVKKINAEEFIVVLKELGFMINAGISLKNALLQSIDSTKNKAIKEILITSLKDIENGTSLSHSFEKYKKTISTLPAAIIGAAEIRGMVGKGFLDLALMLETIKQNQDNIKKALRMPLLSLIVLCGAFIFLILNIIPRFKQLFHKFDTNLPLPTQILLSIENVLTCYGVFLIFVLIVVFLMHKYFYHFNSNYAFKFDAIILKLPFIGNMLRIYQLGYFMNVLSKLLDSNINLNVAIMSALKSVHNNYIQQRLLQIDTTMHKGESFYKAIKNTELFDDIILKMIKTAEESGNFEEMIKNIAHYYQNRFQKTVDSLVIYLEPLLMAVVAIFVLILALGIFMPMWNLSSTIKGG